MNSSVEDQTEQVKCYCLHGLQKERMPMFCNLCKSSMLGCFLHLCHLKMSCSKDRLPTFLLAEHIILLSSVCRPFLCCLHTNHKGAGARDKVSWNFFVGVIVVMMVFLWGSHFCPLLRKYSLFFDFIPCQVKIIKIVYNA